MGLAVDRRFTQLRDLVTGEVLATGSTAEQGAPRGRGMAGGDKVTVRTQIKPHSYRAFLAQ